MDIDAYVAVHRPEWERLQELTRRRRLSGAEADELVTLYQRAATHLSVVRSAWADPALSGWLSSVVVRARGAVTGAHEPPWRELARFVTVSFPAAVYRSRWWSFACAAFTVVVSVAVGVWTARSPRVQASIGSQEQIRQLVNVDFAHYYSEYAATSFAAQVWTNNAKVGAICIALGITGIGPLWVIFGNAWHIGQVGGLMAAYGKIGVFFALITPHGLLELTAVFVAGGAGLQLFWAWVDPGHRPRGQALAEEGRAMVTVALGLVGVLLVSGCVEAFVTPSPLPTWARIGIGGVVWTGFLVYVGTLGRSAVLAGETGDLRAELAGDTRPVAG